MVQSDTILAHCMLVLGLFWAIKSVYKCGALGPVHNFGVFSDIERMVILPAVGCPGAPRIMDVNDLRIFSRMHVSFFFSTLFVGCAIKSADVKLLGTSFNGISPHIERMVLPPVGGIRGHPREGDLADCKLVSFFPFFFCLVFFFCHNERRY